MMMLETLTKQLGYEFRDQKLLIRALTHRSKGGEHNERLEFLGDAVVNFVVAEILYERYPSASEGELSRWRASLVNRDALAQLAKKLELSQYLILGAGELRSGGAKRHSILSCAMEAIIGAVYLDSDFVNVSQCIRRWYTEMVDNLSRAAEHKDPKTMLQEYLQGQRKALPVYEVAKLEGEAHQQIFTVSCQVEGIDLVYGHGTSRRRAEQDAAANMLKQIQETKSKK